MSLEMEPLIHGQLIFTNASKTIEKESFFLKVIADTIRHIYTKQKKNLNQFLNLHHIQKLTQNVLYRHMRYKCKTCL